MLKQFLLLVFGLAIAHPSFGIDYPELRSKGKIEKVTVYSANAKIYSTSKAKIPKGKSWIVIEGLCYGIADNSIQVKINNSRVDLLSAMPRVNYLQQTDKSKHYGKVQDSLEQNQEALDLLKIRMDALAARRNVLMENNPLHKDEAITFTIAQMEEFMKFREKKVQEIDEKAYGMRKEQKALNEQRSYLQRQLQALAGQRQKPSGEIVLQVQSPVEVDAEIICNFIVSNAGWTPIYDLRSEGADKPVRLVYKGIISQSAGIDWEQVKIKLSTANPLQNNDRPILNPSFVDLKEYVQQTKGQNIVIQQNNYDRSYSPSLDVLQEEEYMLEDMPASNTAGEFARKKSAKRAAEKAPLRHNTIKTNQDDNGGGGNSVLEFEIEQLQDIPSDGEKHYVLIGEQDIPATYDYQTVPKLDAGVFLLAKLTDYGQYNLIAGEANLFFEGTYLGQAYIDPRTALDTLMLSLGRDERITVKREKLKDLTSTRTIGGSKRETIVFETTIRNNKSKAVEIELIDQFPVSKNKDLEIKLLESEGAEVLEEIGGLRYKLTVPGNESVKVRLSYSIKYPKGKYVVGCAK